MRPRTLPALASALAATMLNGCGHSPPTRFLTLDAETPGATVRADYHGPPIAVEAVRLPPALDRLEVAEEVSPGTVKVHDFARWAAAPGLLSLSAFTADLSARLPAGAVVYPRAPVPVAARRLVVDVLAFDDTGGQATLDAAWTLLGGGAEGSPILARHVERVRTASTGREPLDEAAALSRLVGLLSDRVAAGLPS